MKNKVDTNWVIRSIPLGLVFICQTNSLYVSSNSTQRTENVRFITLSQLAVNCNYSLQGVHPVSIALILWALILRLTATTPCKNYSSAWGYARLYRFSYKPPGWLHFENNQRRPSIPRSILVLHSQTLPAPSQGAYRLGIISVLWRKVWLSETRSIRYSNAFTVRSARHSISARQWLAYLVILASYCSWVRWSPAAGIPMPS